jgi:uncharacterized protein
MSSERCPSCNTPTVFEFRPFCSARCKLVDLQKWFSESYTIPVVDEDELEETATEENEKKEESH